MLKIIKTKLDLVPNLSNIKNAVQEEPEVKASTGSKYSSNISSSNVKSSLNRVRSYQEYKRIKDEMGYTSLTEEDMRWVDMNVYEDPEVPS